MTTDKTKRFFRVSAEDFKKIPGSPIAYWVSFFNIFNFPKISIKWFSGGRIKTYNSSKYIRYIWEISRKSPHWKRLVKGGDFRKHFGNEFFLVDWSREAISFYEENGGIYPKKYWSKEGICWSKITSSIQSFRVKRAVTEYDSASPTIFNDEFKCDNFILAFLNSKIAQILLKSLNPTINTQITDIMSLPIVEVDNKRQDTIINIEKQLIVISISDWDSYETSWDFQENPLWKERKKGHWVSIVPICQYYQDLRRHWAEQTEEMQTLERCNNNIFIQAYGLQDELSAEVPWDEITLTCNPWYRYGKRPQSESSQETLYQSFECQPDGVKLYQPVSSQSGYCGFPYSQALEERLLEDTMKEFISYAVGCMMGRYSLEKPGLILANQGEDFDDYIAKVMAGTEKQNEQETVRSGFLPDRDGVLPILDDEWFVDDIVAQFKDFLKFTFGGEAFSRNLAFIEKAIGKDIRKYFMKDFYKEHVQRYKKRPIYWLFSSPKGSFNALIYLHRYRPDTVSIVLNDYLREFMTKLRVQRNHLIDDNNRADLSASEKSANLKRIDKYAAMLAELEDYERDILFPLAQKQLAIDLDDGVKVNYLKFGAALKEIPGLKAREE